jgi:ankyrin repeat protein
MSQKTTIKPQSQAAELFISSAAAGDLSRVKTLLAANTDVNAKWTNRVTALFAASQSGHLEVVKALVAAKADVDAKADIGVPYDSSRLLHGASLALVSCWAAPRARSSASPSLLWGLCCR